MTLPAGTRPSDVRLSPDGRRLVVKLMSPDKPLPMYTRSLDATEFNPLDGTEDAHSPFWSPDGRFIGYFADGKLRKIPSAGGPASILCAGAGIGGGGRGAVRT